jgi:hypothetical protein
LDHKPKEIFETIVFAFDLLKKWNTSWYFNNGASIMLMENLAKIQN